jgi:predicted nucleic acid-binding protein
VDTSVWIDFFDHPNTKYAKELESLIEKDEDICLTDLILTEILQGIRNEKIFNQVKEALTKFTILRADDLELYIKAANIYRACRKKGKTVSKTIDVIIAAIAIENNLVLFHKDSDFNLIADCTGLKVLSL